MDKILAFSILSSSPADLAAGGGYYSTRLSWRTTSTSTSGGDQKQQEEKAPKQEKAEQKQGSLPSTERKQQEARPRFAPEFDGLNCFESIVSF